MADIVNGDDTGMGKSACSLDLAAEACLGLPAIGRSHARWQVNDLEGDLPADGRIVTQVDPPHGPLAQFLFQFVSPQRCRHIGRRHQPPSEKSACTTCASVTAWVQAPSLPLPRWT